MVPYMDYTSQHAVRGTVYGLHFPARCAWYRIWTTLPNTLCMIPYMDYTSQHALRGTVYGLHFPTHSVWYRIWIPNTQCVVPYMDYTSQHAVHGTVYGLHFPTRCAWYACVTHTHTHTRRPGVKRVKKDGADVNADCRGWGTNRLGTWVRKITLTLFKLISRSQSPESAVASARQLTQ